VKRPFVLLAAVICVGASQAAQPFRVAQDVPPPADKGVLAVLRRDGILFPFAAFHGTAWSAPWPGGLKDVELPVNLASIPERWWGGSRPDSWRAWLMDGTSREIRALTLAQFRVHCAMRLGVRTDYRPQDELPILPAEPFPKDGLAVSAGIRLEPIEIVKPSSEWTTLAVDLLEHFDRVEDVEVSTVAAAARWRHPFAREMRRKLPVRIESWYRTRVENSVVSFIEAVRSYPPRAEDEGCGLETVFTGWIYHENGKLAKRMDLGARLTYCDRVNAAYMLPFGRIQVKDRIYWVAQYSGHESEWYSVTRLERARVTPVIDYFAGSQESCR
jgi:hypothetical protein